MSDEETRDPTGRLIIYDDGYAYKLSGRTKVRGGVERWISRDCSDNGPMRRLAWRQYADGRISFKRGVFFNHSPQTADEADRWLWDNSEPAEDAKPDQYPGSGRDGHAFDVATYAAALNAKPDPLDSRPWLRDVDDCVIDAAFFAAPDLERLPKAKCLTRFWLSEFLHSLTDEERRRMLVGAGLCVAVSPDGGRGVQAWLSGGLMYTDAVVSYYHYWPGGKGVGIECETFKEAEERALVHLLAEPKPVTVNNFAIMPGSIGDPVEIGCGVFEAMPAPTKTGARQTGWWTPVENEPIYKAQMRANGDDPETYDGPKGVKLKMASTPRGMKVPAFDRLRDPTPSTAGASILNEAQRRFLYDTKAPPSKGAKAYGIEREKDYDPGPPCEAVRAEMEGGDDAG